MSFEMRTWKDRDVQFPGKRTLINASDNTDMQDVVVSRAEGTVTKTGDLFSASVMNDLEQRIFNAFDSIASDLTDEFDSIYPIGCIYKSFDNTNPGELFKDIKETTWVAIENRLLRPVPTSEQSLQQIGNNGNTITRTPIGSVYLSGFVGYTALSIDQIPSHTHTIENFTEYESGGGQTVRRASGEDIKHQQTLATSTNGSGQGHNHGFSATTLFSGTPFTVDIRQPYITIHAWRRTS